MWNLQTLKTHYCMNLKELPKDIKELVNLKYLDNSHCNSLSYMCCGLGQLTSLQILSLFVVGKVSKHFGGLGELNRLNNLRGRLEIKHLEQLEDDNLESKAANLREKQHLVKLKLSWDQDDNINNDDEMSLDCLQPHPNLKALEVIRCGGVRFSSWLSLLTNLVDLDLFNCTRCQHLPPLYGLPSLESLKLRFMVDLEYITDSDIFEEFPASLTMSTPFIPSLKLIIIEKCNNLRRWWRRDLITIPNDQQHQLLPSFPRLSSLEITDCPNLTSMPLFPYLKKDLRLHNVSLKLLQSTMTIASSLPSSSSSFVPLSKLKCMIFDNINDEYLTDKLASNLDSLNQLCFKDCPRLSSLPRAMPYLTSLEDLRIENCKEFNLLSDMDGDGMEWRRLNCLRNLTFLSLQKLASLPASLQ